MRRTHPQFNFRIMSFIVKSTFVVFMFAPVFHRISTAAVVNNNDEEQFSENIAYNYQCFTDTDDASSKLSFSGTPIGIQVSYWPSHQIISRIFAIFLREVLNYRNVYMLPIQFHGNTSDIFYEEKKLSYTLDLIKKHPQYSSVPMVNLGVWMPSLGHALKPQLVFEAGVSVNSVRFGWFVAPDSIKLTTDGLHYSVFLNRSHPFYEQYIMDDEQLNILRPLNKSDYYTSPMCVGVRCATLLAEFKNETSFVQQQIVDMNGYLNIYWLGSRFRSEIDRLHTYYTSKYSNATNKRFLVLHWYPSDVIDTKYTFQQIQLPLCEEISWNSYCKYELTPIIKYYSQTLFREERLMDALRNFWIDNAYLTALFDDLNQRRLEQGHVTDDTYNELACEWMQSNPNTYNTWISQQTITLSIGGIFPIKKNSRGHQNLVHAVNRAMHAINNNKTILSNYNLSVAAYDGECKADIVMKGLLSYYSSYPKLLGVLGPACSETVEPIAGISRHTQMTVISYSAEGASFFDRQAYPFFFRTIGSNRQYEDMYTALMKDLGWKRVAALTEDGQKYTEYISHMEATLKNNNLELIINKKFQSEITSTEMNKYLIDLKKKSAKIIIADVHNKYAQMALCEAYRLKMTAYHGYVWFLPSWLSKDWSALSGQINGSCTIEELEMAFEGHFSIMHSPFGNNKTTMQENIPIQTWLDSYSSSVDSVSQYTAFAYDAVWVYAMATDKLLRENKAAIENLRSNEVVNRLVDLIWETDFEGLSGRVRFGQGGSRLSELLIMQWRNNRSMVIGKYIPHLIGDGRNLRTNGGGLFLNRSAIVWLSDDKPPGDGTYDCRFSTLAEFLNTECENATLAFTAVLCLIIVLVISLISFLFWKRRYDKKLKRSAKIMKNFGIDLLSPSRSNANTLDKWEIPKENVVVNRRLGEGAFGTVYGGEAQIGSEGWTAVAVKTLKTGASTEDRLDFLSEAEAMKRFDHKNIVKLLGVCLQSEPIYTIMEFMLYGDLKTYLLARRHLVNEKINEHSDIASKRLTMYATDVSRGLAYLAQQKYVHRDIACRNCLVNAQRVVKLGDFGMSRPTYESDYYRFNRKGMLPVRWMAPESLALGMFTPASDVWAFGVVLFEIITFGSFPYQGLTNNQVLEYVKRGNTLNVPIGLKPQLEGLIKACWNKDSKKRPTASEIVEYISKYPSLLTPCLDFPSASVEMPETESDELELLPKARKCSPLKNDSVLDVVAQTSLADTMERLNHFANERDMNEQVDIEMPLHIESHGPEQVDTYSPITPDGYSIMSPLLMQQSSQSSAETHKQTPF